MLDLYRDALRGQYAACFDMLRSAIETCPDDLWDDEYDGGPAVWRLAYHTLFFLGLYFAEGEKQFDPPAFHEQWHQMFQPKVPFPPYDIELPTTVLSKPQLLGYLDQLRGDCRQILSRLTEPKLAEKSPFGWQPFTVAELIIYNLRHAQHHVGQLNLILRRRANVENPWVGTATL